jgi:hypothetical protein
MTHPLEDLQSDAFTLRGLLDAAHHCLNDTPGIECSEAASGLHAALTAAQHYADKLTAGLDSSNLPRP